MASRLTRFLYDTQETTKRMKVAVVALELDFDPGVNREKMVHMVNIIKEAHSDIELIAFGELTLGWYCPDRRPEYHWRTAESVPGETTETISNLAVEYGIYVSFGLTESCNGKLFNTQVLINPAGENQAIHRKMHPRDSLYAHGAMPVTITNINGIKTGIVICSDTANPRTMWELIKNRLDLILLSLADDSDEGLFMTCFNARMYDAWIVTPNRFGDEDGYFWDGHMVISDPLGGLQATARGQEQYLVHELRFANDRSWLKSILRNILVKAPLSFHVLRNWSRARTYL